MTTPLVGNSPARPTSIPEPQRPPVIVQAPPDQSQGMGGMDPQTMQALMALIAMLMHGGMGGAMPGGMPGAMPAPAPMGPSTEPMNPNALPPMGPTGPGLPMQGAPNPLAAMMGGNRGR